MEEANTNYLQFQKIAFVEFLQVIVAGIKQRRHATVQTLLLSAGAFYASNHESLKARSLAVSGTARVRAHSLGRSDVKRHSDGSATLAKGKLKPYHRIVNRQKGHSCRYLCCFRGTDSYSTIT